MKKSIFKRMGKLTVILLITAGCTKNSKETANIKETVAAVPGNDSLTAIQADSIRSISTSSKISTIY